MWISLLWLFGFILISIIKNLDPTLFILLSYYPKANYITFAAVKYFLNINHKLNNKQI
jgi:hypothetical protein